MARLRLTITIDAGWQPDDELLLMVGTENAVDLAASVPAGGEIVQRLVVGEAQAGETVVLEHEHFSQDKCATLPVGVAIKDTQGNVSVADEHLLALRDPPVGVGRPDVAATANPNEALLTWVESPDVG